MQHCLCLRVHARSHARYMLFACVLAYVFNQRRVAQMTEEAAFVRRQAALMRQQPYKARRVDATRSAHSSCDASGGDDADAVAPATGSDAR